MAAGRDDITARARCLILRGEIGERMAANSRDIVARSPPARTSLGSKSISRTLHAHSSLIQYVRIDHRRLKTCVTEELLNSAYVGPALQQVRRKGVAERVACHTLSNRARPGS